MQEINKAPKVDVLLSVSCCPIAVFPDCDRLNLILNESHFGKYANIQNSFFNLFFFVLFVFVSAPAGALGVSLQPAHLLPILFMPRIERHLPLFGELSTSLAMS